jgi:predicted MFS family arabinose efflux permease
MTDNDSSSWTERLSGLLAANMLFAVGLFAHAFLYNFYLEQLGFTPLEMGRAQAALTAGGLLALLPAGRLVDRMGPRDTAVVATVITALGLAAGALAASQPLVLLSAAGAGAGAATWRVASGPLMLAVAPPDQRARGFSWSVGLVVAAGGIVFALSGAAPDMLVRRGMALLSAQRVTLLAGAALTAAAALGYARLRPSQSVLGVTQEASGAEGAWNERRLAAAVGAILVWMLAAAAVGPFFNLYFARVHHLSLTATGALLGVGHLVTAVALFASAELASRRGTAWTLRGWLLLLPLALLALAAGPPLVLAGLFYFGQGCVAPATNPLIDQLTLERAPPQRRGAVASWRNAATEASGVVGAAAAGALIAERGFGALFAGAAVVGLIGAVLVAWTLTPVRRAG